MRIHIDNSAPVEPALTRRQSTIVILLSEGLQAKQIAQELGISPRTVDHHIYAAKRATSTTNATALVAKAIRQKLIS